MATKLPSFEEDLNIIQKLGDTPGTDNNLSSAELKAKFDEAGNRLKNYLNRIVPMLNEAFGGEGAVLSGGTLIGDLDINGNKLSGLRTPTANTDAANKKYVDDAEKAAKDASLPLAGGTMEGSINMGGNTVKNVKAPVASGDAVNKDYVDRKHDSFTQVLQPAMWSGAGPYTLELQASTIKATDIPHITPLLLSTTAIATRRAIAEAWACVSSAETGDGKITFTCFDTRPDFVIPIQIEVIR